MTSHMFVYIPLRYNVLLNNLAIRMQFEAVCSKELRSVVLVLLWSLAQFCKRSCAEGNDLHLHAPAQTTFLHIYARCLGDRVKVKSKLENYEEKKTFI